MHMVLPGSPAKGEYHGPGWSEWILGFGCTILAATQLRSIYSSPEQQTALSYYFQEPGIRAFHVAGATIDFAIVIVVAAWIFAAKKAEIWGFLLMALCMGGLVVGWAELVHALTPNPNRVYVLQGLPFSPVNNAGLLGAAVFMGYFATKVPMGSMGMFVKLALKVALWVGLFGVQWILFEQMAGRIS